MFKENPEYKDIETVFLKAYNREFSQIQ